jgi:hypothetical protein
VVYFIKTTKSQYYPKTVVVYYACSNFGGFIKCKFGAYNVQPAPLAARSISVMQRAALAACIIYKYLNGAEQHFACCQKWRRPVRSIAYTSKGIGNNVIFYETGLWLAPRYSA